MINNIFQPFHTMQEINLDWILTKIKNILRFVPDDGAVGQILRRTPSGAEWSDEQGAGGSVTSVNGMQGAVVLIAADVGALPDSTTIPTNTSDLNNDSGFITAAQAPVQSVNGQTGTVTISVPTNTSDLNNDSGFVDAAGAAAAAPVQSVNGQTGAVVIPSLSPTEYDEVNSSTSNAATVHTYTVSGTGFLIISANLQSDSTSDFGIARAIIIKNGINFAYDQCVMDNARAYPIGASCTCAFTVQTGDIVETNTIGTKNGTKTHIVHILAFGCTLT